MKKKAADIGTKIMPYQEFLDYVNGRELTRMDSALAAETKEVLKAGKLGIEKESFKRREPEGGPSRLEPTSAPKGLTEVLGGKKQENRKFPPRRPGGIE